MFQRLSRPEGQISKENPCRGNMFREIHGKRGDSADEESRRRPTSGHSTEPIDRKRGRIRDDTLHPGSWCIGVFWHQLGTKAPPCSSHGLIAFSFSPTEMPDRRVDGE
jgi:hypothetical protein